MAAVGCSTVLKRLLIKFKHFLRRLCPSNVAWRQTQPQEFRLVSSEHGTFGLRLNPNPPLSGNRITLVRHKSWCQRVGNKFPMVSFFPSGPTSAALLDQFSSDKIMRIICFGFKHNNTLWKNRDFTVPMYAHWSLCCPPAPKNIITCRRFTFLLIWNGLASNTAVSTSYWWLRRCGFRSMMRAAFKLCSYSVQVRIKNSFWLGIWADFATSSSCCSCKFAAGTHVYYKIETSLNENKRYTYISCPY